MTAGEFLKWMKVFKVSTGGAGGGGVWGAITGTLSAQTDLQSALDSKQGSGTYTTLGFTTVQTSATPTAGGAVAPASFACNGLIVQNGLDNIEYQRNGAGAFYPIPAGNRKFIVGITDASQIGFRHADYATIVVGERPIIDIELINTTASYTVTQLSLATSANSTYTAFGSNACVAMLIANYGQKAMNVKVFAGSPKLLNRNEKILITGLTNSSDVSIVAFDNNGGGLASAEIFQAIPTIDLTPIAKSNILAPETTMVLDDLTGTKNQLAKKFAMIPFFTPFPRFDKKKSKSITIFQNVANTTFGGGATGTTTNVTLTGDQRFPTWCETAIFGADTAVQDTITGTGTRNYTSSVNTINPIDVTAGDIHVDIRSPNFGTGTITAVNIDLFSTGSPTAPGVDFHTLNVVNDLEGWITTKGITPANGFGSRSYSASLFAASGAGATMTAITFGRIRVTVSSTGSQFWPCEISYVPKASTKGSFIFTFDDNYASSLTDAFQILAPYGYPGVFFPSPTADKTGNSNNTGGNIQPDNMIAMCHRHGWQIASQDYRNELSVNMTAKEWLISQQKQFILGAMLGYDQDGMRDGSFPGGGIAVTSDQYGAAHTIYASMRQFNAPQSTNAATVQPAFAFYDTNPPGDPMALKALNVIGYTSGTDADKLARFKDAVDAVIAIKGMLIFPAHGDWSNAATKAILTSLVAYIDTKVQAGTAQVVTLKELRRQSYS